jgi:DNA polymerase I-like protein with 3'-5' exonuclease and polymerase domains
VAEEGIQYSQRPFGLKEVAERYLKKDAKAEQTAMKGSILKNGGTATEFYKADLDLMAKYCMQDCAMTVQLQNMFHERMVVEGTVRFFYEDEVMPLLKHVTIPMENKGVPVDLEALSAAKAEIQQDLNALESEIQAAIKPHLNDFEIWFLNKDYPPRRSGPFANYIVDLLAPNKLPRTESGAYSFAAKAIAALEPGLLKDWLEERIKLPPDMVERTQRALHGTTPTFNLLSKHHLKKLFFEELDETPLSRTELGAPQVDDDFLQSVATKYEWVPKLQDFNRLTKILGTYIDRFLNEQENGIWYPSFFQHRTVSGRYGSSAQQLPRKLEEGAASEVVRKYNNMIRDFFIAGPECMYVGADYESLEPHVFAHVSGDERIKDIFRKGHDFYSTIAIMTERIQGVSADKKAPNYLGALNKAKRQSAKSYALGIPYGMTGYKLQFELGCSQDEADHLVNSYLEAFPDLASWIQRSHQDVKAQGFVRTESGRIRHMWSARDIASEYGDDILDSLQLWKMYHENPREYERMKKLRREYKNYLNNACNVQIQGLSASIVNRACIQLAKEFKTRGLSAYICLQIHDEVVVRAPKHEVRLVCQLMQRCLETAYPISIPLKAEPCVAYKYGETK